MAIMTLVIGVLPNLANAVEFRSVAVPKAVLYDAPSEQGKKLFLLGQGYPVEVIVNLGDWLKVRDNQGGLSWVAAKQLATKRTALVTASEADIRQAADANSAIVGHVEKDVVLDIMEPAANGWVKVHHRDGLIGYVSITALWGL